MTPAVPPALARTFADLFGETGVAWVARLPAHLAAVEARWGLTIGPPFANLSYHYVAPATLADGTDAVLKTSVPHAALRREIAALRQYDGRGVVRLLADDADVGVMLLERLRPGTPLSQIEDDERATVLLARAMRDAWRPVPAGHSFPSVAERAAGLARLRARFDGETGPFPAPLVERAEHLFADLIASMAEPVLLHGDLHHDNVLAATRQPWLVIDPKGVAGEPAAEVGPILYNPAPRLETIPALDRLLARRLDLLAETLAMDRARLAGWGLAQAVLSAWWGVEDHGHVPPLALAVAGALAPHAP